MKDDIGGAYLLVYDDIEVTYNPTRRLVVAPSHDMAAMSCRYVIYGLSSTDSGIRTLLH